MSRASRQSVITTGAKRTSVAVGVLTVATFWTVTAEMLPSGLLRSMSSDLNVSESAIGALVSAWAVTIAIVSIPLVRLTLRLQRNAVLAFSLGATAVANLGTALAPDFASALVGRVVAASAPGLFWAVVVSYVSTLVPPERLGRTLSIVLAGPTLAGFLGLPAAVFMAEYVSWRWVFAGLSLLLLLTAALLWGTLPRAARSHHVTDHASGVWDSTGRGVIFVAAGGGLVLIGHFAAFTYIAVLVTGSGGLSDASVALVLLALGGAGAFGIAAAGFAADRYPRGALIAVAALVTAGLGVLLLAGTNPVAFYSAVILWGFAVGALPPILQARVLRLSSPSFRPLAGSIVVTVLNIGVAAGAALGGIALRNNQHTLVTVAFVAAASGALALCLGPRRVESTVSNGELHDGGYATEIESR